MRLTLEDRFRHQIDQYLYDPWDDGPVVLAVSGGSDSTALMHLAAATMDRARLHILTVDHGLRDVDAEIDLVARQARSLGVPHSVLLWRWDGSGNLQAAARNGRWTAIKDWCAAHQGDIACLTGHTRDDQAETFLMRLARGSGVAGLAGMAPTASLDLTNGHGLRVVRPLLDATRAELQAWLTGQGISWSHDPSNDDARFDRIKARGLMDQLSQLGLSQDRIVQTSNHMAAARREMRAYAVMVAKAHITQQGGDVMMPINWPQHPEVAARLFRHALHYVGQGPYPPRSDASDALWHGLKNGTGGTLHGCFVSAHGDVARISREPSAVAEPMAWPHTDVGVLWDGRWLVSCTQTGDMPDDLHVGALGGAIKDVPEWRETGVPRASLLASPAVFKCDTLISAPVAGLQNGFCVRIVADFESFLVSR
ncbi:tRNA lysidine(34) synthetase TilS [Octadecabacter sp. G9-8]|uniref:tRNA(Ile)-lysidine synthase n=1 Tax=Octadecabacter dasysiphoniae TaxID=2909341 RepID=A0ABS9CRA4_9RHOB|nr:tRNA lysidine(34) synthetase TilS [Octadecabacter dasysiphoniae]MCF2869768.1 tRNA lysidine(34) synthetase TilS [Octadecabacter dasysiphoniae]